MGTAQFGLPYGINNKAGQVCNVNVRAILKIAASAGIDTLDTAIAYGESEFCLGQVGVQSFNVVSKLPACPDNHPDPGYWVNSQLMASIGRLGVPSLYGLLLHEPKQLVEPVGRVIYRALEKARDDGIIQKVGVSIYSPLELEVLWERYRFDLVQAPLNLVDRRIFLSGWLDRLKEAGVEIHARSAFLQGLLVMPHAEIPRRFHRWDNLWQCWHAWLARHNALATQVCMTYPLSFGQIDRVVVGVDAVKQLEELIEIVEHPRPMDDMPDIACFDEQLINPSNWN